MKLWAWPVCMAAFLVASSAVGSAQIKLRPGEYETTIELNMAGVSREEQQALAGLLNQKQISRQCKTADEVGDAANFAKALAQEGSDLNCKISDTRTSGNKMTFVSTCLQDGERMTSSNEVTFGPDTYTVVMIAKDGADQTSTFKITSKRIGECKP
jgi:hypothetical protein